MLRIHLPLQLFKKIFLSYAKGDPKGYLLFMAVEVTEGPTLPQWRFTSDLRRWMIFNQEKFRHLGLCLQLVAFVNQRIDKHHERQLGGPISEMLRGACSRRTCGALADTRGKSE